MLKPLLLTCVALIAFAGNSVLCRLALQQNLIDASSFTSIRLMSGAIALIIINLAFYHLNSTANTHQKSTGSWLGALSLFIYASAFSFAYVSVDTATGALILFGAVQITMLTISFFTGNRLTAVDIAGLLIAFSGFIYLVQPQLSSPSMLGVILMTISGGAWGIYTLSGKGSMSPLQDTRKNFLLTIPFVIILFISTVNSQHVTIEGIYLAIASGAITSALGYSIWYAALPLISTNQAAVSQLSVPVIAAIGGTLFVGEPITARLLIASLLVLGGIVLVIVAKHNKSSSPSSQHN